MTFVSTTRMSPSLSFRLRTDRVQGEGMIYCRLRYDGLITTEYRIYVTVPIDQWPDLPAIHPQSAGIRLQLAQVRADHQWLALNLSEPTAVSIKNAWIARQSEKRSPRPLSPLVTQVYADYLKMLITPPKRKKAPWRPPAGKTMDNRRMVLTHLGAFLARYRLPALRMHNLRASHGHSFADYLSDLGISKNTAIRYLNYWSESIDYAARYDESISVNPLRFVKIKGDPVKQIKSLPECDLIRLTLMNLTGIYHTVRQWCLLMAYTGLDYHDALQVTADLGSYYRKTPYGDTLVFQRLKYEHAPEWGTCHIPIMPTTELLLSDVLNWKRPKLKVINTHLKKIGQMLGLSFSLNAKLFRKSAGVVLLLYYEDIYLVQKAMGHQSVKTTELYYLNLPPEVVTKAMKRKRENMHIEFV